MRPFRSLLQDAEVGLGSARSFGSPGVPRRGWAEVEDVDDVADVHDELMSCSTADGEPLILGEADEGSRRPRSPVRSGQKLVRRADAVGRIMRARASSTSRACRSGCRRPSGRPPRSGRPDRWSRRPRPRPARPSGATRWMSPAALDVVADRERGEQLESRSELRAMRRARKWVKLRVMSLPSRSTVPEPGRSSPDTTLNSVVLPAPLGPIGYAARLPPPWTPRRGPRRRRSGR